MYYRHKCTLRYLFTNMYTTSIASTAAFHWNTPIWGLVASSSSTIEIYISKARAEKGLKVTSVYCIILLQSVFGVILIFKNAKNKSD